MRHAVASLFLIGIVMRNLENIQTQVNVRTPLIVIEYLKQQIATNYL